MDAAHDAASASVVADVNQSTISQTQKRKKKKNTGMGQSDPAPADSVERRIEPPAEPAGAPEPPVRSSKTKERKKTVVLDLSTVIQTPAAAQVCLDPSVSRTIDLRDMPGTGASLYISSPTALPRG